MAEEVEMIPVDAAEPPLAKPAVPKLATAKASPPVHRPVIGGTVTAALKPGLKLPPKPGMAAGLKLPPKPATVTAALKPGIKLPTATLKPGIRLPAKPVIRKPGATVTAAPLPKPVAPLAAKPAEKPETVPAQASIQAQTSAPTPVAAAKPEMKPVAVDAQGVGKLPTVEAKAVDRADTTPVVSANPNPMEALKSVTQKLKGLTQEIPQQAILRKTGIIAEGAMSEAQKEAAKHKTARISLSDAMGVAPVKNENAPMKTIRIKRPVDIAGSTKTATLTPSPAAQPAKAPGADLPSAETGAAEPSEAAASTSVTQRKTLKISRPGGAVRPAGKFGIKRSGAASTAAAEPAAADAATSEKPAEGTVADIAEIPDMPIAPVPAPKVAADDGPAWLVTLSTLVQAAACVAIGALAWFLFQNTQVAYF